MVAKRTGEQRRGRVTGGSVAGYLWSQEERYHLLAGLLVGRAPAGAIGDEAEWEALLALAQAESVGPLLHRAIGALPAGTAPPAAAEALARTYREAVHASLLVESARGWLCRELHERAIPALLLKGAALAFSCYDDPATRPMGDLDLLVPRSRLTDTARCLEEAGFELELLPRSLVPALNRPRFHHVYVHPRSQTVVELHWELRGVRDGQAEVLAEIWAHAAWVDSRTGARMLSTEHMVPLLAAHMTLQHKRATLLWLYDLHRALLAASAPVAARVPDVADRWGLAPCTAHALLQVKALFGTPLPEALEIWAAATAAQKSLQGNVARLALAPCPPEMPDGGLLNLALEGDWRRLRSLLPAPAALRERLGLGPYDRVSLAYAALLARYARKAPAHVRRLWRLRRAANGLQSDAIRLSPGKGSPVDRT